jgi:hypothetical protein
MRIKRAKWLAMTGVATALAVAQTLITLREASRAVRAIAASSAAAIVVVAPSVMCGTM